MQSLKEHVFFVVGLKPAVDGLSLFQYACIHHDEDTVNVFLKLCPTAVDLCEVLQTQISASAGEELRGERLPELMYLLYKVLDEVAYLRIYKAMERQLGDWLQHIGSAEYLKMMSEVSAKHGKLKHVKKYFRDKNFLYDRNSYNRAQNELQLAVGFNTIEVIEYIVSRSNLSKDKPWRGNTPMHYAARMGRLQVMKYLYRAFKGIMLEETTAKNWVRGQSRDKVVKSSTPLHAAVYGGDKGAIDFILQIGADINHNTDASDLGFFTLELDCSGKPRLLREGRTDFVEVRHSPIMFAVQSNKISVFHYLREKGATYGRTILFSAALSGNHEIFKELADEGLDLNVKANVVQIVKTKHQWKITNQSCSLLHCVSNINTAKYLIESGTNVNETNGDGNTPLHIAASKCNIEMVNFLLQNSASASIPNTSMGICPFEYGIRYVDSLEKAKKLYECFSDQNISKELSKHVIDSDPDVLQMLLDDFGFWFNRKVSFYQLRVEADISIKHASKVSAYFKEKRW